MTIRPSPCLLRHPSITEALVRSIHLDIAECIHFVDAVFFLDIGLIWWPRSFVAQY